MDPGIQPYVEAPLPERMMLLPWQIVPAEEDAVTEGKLFTVTATVPVFEHPFAAVPVTV